MVVINRDVSHVSSIFTLNVTLNPPLYLLKLRKMLMNFKDRMGGDLRKWMKCLIKIIRALLTISSVCIPILFILTLPYSPPFLLFWGNQHDGNHGRTLFNLWRQNTSTLSRDFANLGYFYDLIIPFRFPFYLFGECKAVTYVNYLPFLPCDARTMLYPRRSRFHTRLSPSAKHCVFLYNLNVNATFEGARDLLLQLKCHFNGTFNYKT